MNSHSQSKSPELQNVRQILAQVETALALTVPGVARDQNRLINILGGDAKERLERFPLLAKTDQKAVVATLARIQNRETQFDQFQKGSGLAQPKVWRINEQIESIEETKLTFVLKDVTKPASALDMALGAVSATKEKHLYFENQNLGVWDESAGLIPGDISPATRIRLSSGKKIYILETPAPIHSWNKKILLGGFIADGRDTLKHDCPLELVSTLDRSRRPVHVPALKSELQLEGFTKDTYPMSGAWPGKAVARESLISDHVAQTVDIFDLVPGIPTDRTFALHEVSSFQKRTGRGYSDGRVFVPTTRPSNFENDDRMIKALKAVSAERWPDLIKAIRYGYPSELLKRGFYESTPEEVKELLDAKSNQKRAEPETGCFHGYNGVDIQIANGRAGKPYIIFKIERPKADPIFVVDTPEVGAGFGFTKEEDAKALATGEISAREASKVASFRIVHSGNPADWMARFDAALKELGVVKA